MKQIHLYKEEHKELREISEIRVWRRTPAKIALL